MEKSPAKEPLALSFEEALKELEDIVRKLEGSQTNLEDAIALYERGTLLRKQCEELLKNARLKIDEISVDETGTPHTSPSTLSS